jgi:hypothetical protein
MAVGADAGVLIYGLHVPLAIAIPAGAVLGVICAAAALRFQAARWRGAPKATRSTGVRLHGASPTPCSYYKMSSSICYYELGSTTTEEVGFGVSYGHDHLGELRLRT